MRGGEGLEVTIKGEAKEIAALVLVVQGRRVDDIAYDAVKIATESVQRAIDGIVARERST